MSYKPQYTPGETKIAQNRRNHLDPEFEMKKIRSINDEDIVSVLGHRNPGESYKSVHPPLDEMDFDEDMMKDLVEPIPGA
ncbi:coenzyme-B sulfoethylthiotransferase subunit gamma, partial [Methanobacterium formicicum]|uniref:coenzyme-B sulfoethylthiotransferase subunit gamma n=1 Tax=Methanobacterium formicicum TaxID=2162 RepID=UPI002490BB27